MLYFTFYSALNNSWTILLSQAHLLPSISVEVRELH